MKKIKVLISKVGLDGHDRGAKIVARALRDAGMEVIYLGIHQTPEKIVNAAIQEDANFIGISIHSGAHMTLLPKVMELLKESGARELPVICGGIISDEDEIELKKAGIKKVFRPGTSSNEIIHYIKENIR